MNASESKRRWFHPTPGWLVLGSLAMTCLLLLSRQYHWSVLTDLDEMTIVLAVGSMGIMLLAMLLWFIAALLFGWRFQFTIRSLLLLVVAVAIPCGLVANRMREAEHQRQGVAIVQRVGGDVHDTQRPPSSGWWHKLLRDVFFDEIRCVDLNPGCDSISDADLHEIVRLLPHIQILHLNSTGITDAQLNTIAALKELWGLHLRNTKITDAGLGYLATLTNLRLLLLDNAQVTDAGLELLRVHELYVLGLNGTQVTDAGMAYMDGHNLCWLELNNTRVSDSSMEHVRKQKRLQQLLLSGTSITDAGLARLTGLDDLRYLNLSRTRITDNGVKHLADVGTLMELDLSGTQITDGGLEYLKDLNELQTLNLANTKITDSGLDRFAALKPEGLDLPAKLSLVGTKTTKAGVKRLQQAWPNCSIER